MTSELVKVRDALSQISKGKDVNEDSWMVMWSNQNWGELLQPAPLSIALLGSLMVIASSAKDFSLIDATKGTPIQPKYVKYPTSFRASLQQLVGESYIAFETALQSMTRINNVSSQLPAVIRRAVETTVQSPSSKEVEVLLPIELDSVVDYIDKCIDASQTCEQGFLRVSSLAQEIMVYTTQKIGAMEETTAQDAVRLAIPQRNEEEMKKLVGHAKELCDMTKKLYTDAEKQFQTAIENIPQEWDVLGMHVIEDSMHSVTAPMNAFLGTANVKGQYARADQPQLSDRTTQASDESLSDPGVFLAAQILGFVRILSFLVSGGPDSKPDKHNDHGSGNVGLFIETSLQTMKDRLDGTKPISKDLLPIVTRAVEIAKTANMATKSNDGNAHDQRKPAVKKMIEDLESIVTRCNLILQQTGNPAAGPATRGTPKGIQSNAIAERSAIESAKFRVDQARANLQAARDAYDKAAAQMIEHQRQVTDKIALMPEVSLGNATMREITPVLMQMVKALMSIGTQFSQMMHFFSSVKLLVEDAIKPQVRSLVKNIEDNSWMVLSGVSLSDWSRHVMYAQMMGVLKVSMLMERISGMYLNMWNSCIMPALREVGHLLQFKEGKSEEDIQELSLKILPAQAVIREKSRAASDMIIELFAEDKKKFLDTINRRLEAIQSKVGKVLPAAEGPVPQHIASVTKAHVKKF